MALTIEQALQQGVAAHNAGNLKELNAFIGPYCKPSPSIQVRIIT